MLKVDLQRLSRRLKYTFNDLSHLKRALTHCSMGSENNERYEFLGDSILNFVIANELFQRFPDYSEGKLSRLRAFLVKGEMLAELAMELELGDYLYLGQGELKSGGFRRASILADALEAVIAAIFLDGGIDSSQQFIQKIFFSRLEDAGLHENLKDAKTLLQEYLQSEKKPLPEYTVLKTEGDEHDQVFYIVCSVPGLKKNTQGFASNRRKAEQQAARLMLQYLKQS